VCVGGGCLEKNREEKNNGLYIDLVKYILDEEEII
jgi:hypothetical protein